MNRTLIATLVLWSALAHAEVYRCPPTYPDQTYPVKNVPNAPLTGAEIMFGERPSSGPPYPDGWITPDEIAKEGGMDFRYWLAEDEQGWLICTYGAQKRIKGRFQSGKEWGQHMESGQPWFVKLPPRIKGCMVQARENKPPDSSKSTWAVTATCEK
jgi:hypothetical protein